MVQFPLASIPATEVRMLSSTIADQDYQISVALPFHYEDNPQKTYPVIYLLDANLYFGMVVDMVRAMNIRVPFCNELPDAIIVGIGYPVTGSLAERLHHVMNLRDRDFTPERDEASAQMMQEFFPLPNPVVNGGGRQFLQFIVQELVPLIESEYRADPTDRTFMGHSSAAYFALYTLFQQPHVFQRYVVASIYLGEGQDLGMISPNQHDSLPVRLHLVNEVANEEEVTRFQAYVELLERQHYPGFRLTYQIMTNYTHCAVVPPAFQAGLVAVFS